MEAEVGRSATGAGRGGGNASGAGWGGSAEDIFRTIEASFAAAIPLDNLDKLSLKSVIIIAVNKKQREIGISASCARA